MEEVSESSKNVQRIRQCLHFDNCNAIKCPLDELIDKRIKLSENKGKCQLGKATRMKLSRDMKTKGLNRYEIAALVRFHGSFEKGIKSILN